MHNEKKLERRKQSYREIRTKCLDALTGDHSNAIWQQMAHMIIDEVWFKAVLGIRKQAENPPFNAHLWSAFITGYGIKQSLAIRRLTEPKDGVASLLTIVKKIKKNASLLTRDVVVGHDGTPMDLGPLFDAMSQQEKTIGRNRITSSNPLDVQHWSNADHAHKAFDRLRDVELETRRSPADRISDQVLNRMHAALTSDAIKRVRHQCDKYLAHADLSDLSHGLKSPTYNDIHDSIKTLIAIKQFLCADFFNHSGGSVVPTYQGNEFEHLSDPLVPAMPIGTYREVFKEVEEEIERWGSVDEFRRFSVYPE